MMPRSLWLRFFPAHIFVPPHKYLSPHASLLPQETGALTYLTVCKENKKGNHSKPIRQCLAQRKKLGDVSWCYDRLQKSLFLLKERGTAASKPMLPPGLLTLAADSEHVS